MLTIHEKVEQRSDEWYELRRGIVTASSVGKLITPKTIKPASNPESRSYISLLASERISGWIEPGFVNAAMQRGIDGEPIARNLYAEHHAPVAEVGFMVLEVRGYRLGYSPDGLVGEDGLLEVKTRSPKVHVETILAGEVPDYNMAQLQCGLMVSGRKWVDYVSYCGGMSLWVRRVHPDPRWQNAIDIAVGDAETAILNAVNHYNTATAELPMTEHITYEELGLVI